MNVINHYIYGGANNVNTIIGGVAASISTPALLASKLSIAVSAITRFDIVGSDIHAHIMGTYLLNSAVFKNDTSITSFIDMNGKFYQTNGELFRDSTINNVVMPGLTTMNNGLDFAYTRIVNLSLPSYTGGSTSTPSSQTFRNNPMMKTCILDSATTLNPSQLFINNTSMELISYKKLKSYGNPAMPTNSGNDSGFLALKTGCTIETNIFMRTANAGAPHNAFVYAKNSRGAIVKFYDDAGNYVSTL